ncbi:chemotaxis protein CheW [Pseudoduganella chitinolytica]|uniref:Chemotaxis protein CheW n=1 Tax=Pseudoduganella chitinolytica TaxID=34070 RepID=A0ABY8BJP4_9BURK|nr:chemotaxis protein CheW [Pseudoduganella chitinolytica]WEF35573.1 chemotaxis protein CheW [Pseudoduganella chitinolytica]
MKLLVFHIGADRYGLPLGTIRQVLPLMALKAVPLAPAAIAGLMNLHGSSVPVVDVALSSGAAPAARQVDTRIVLVDYGGPDGTVHALGLLVERVVGVQDVAAQALADSGVQAAPFLGQVAGDAQGLVQLVHPERLLPDALRAALFPATAAGGRP